LCCKASEFNFNKKFDIITALFHVMSYQTQTEELEKVFENAARHLAQGGGIFLFDFWYGPAVLSDPPVVRIKRLENEDMKITRIAEPVMHYNENIVDVNYEMIIEDKKTYIADKIKETHRMRYLFLPEIEFFLNKAGLKVIDSSCWMQDKPLSADTWYGVVVAGK
jgi:SAM-dependent methyltransferase